MGNSQQVFQSIFKRGMFENGGKDFITAIAKEYPYFTAAQFYLLQKSEPGSDDYNKQLAKAAVLFNNPFWLNYQLEQSFGSTGLPHQFIAAQVGENDSPPNIAIDETATIYNRQSGAIEPDFKEEISLEKNSDFQADGPAQVVGSSEITGISEHSTEIIPEAIDKIIETEAVSETPAFTAEIEPVHQYNEGIIQEKTVRAIEASQQETEMPEIDSSETNNVPENNIENYGMPVAETVGNEPPILLAVENELATASPAPRNADAEIQNIPEINPEEPGEEVPEKEAEPLRFTLNFTNATATTEDTIAFDPLHTSDYFASLGIKFGDEIKADDKLGKHLKSFTEWLKTMKKIHPDQLTQQSVQSETIIQQMAEKSNTEGEVLTEAMAEVLLQQGKLGKAIELYQKLSLLNPLKSAYFAAKIDKIER
jgi:hypothetical protein